MNMVAQDTIEDSLALQRSKEKFRILFEKIPVGMAIFDSITGRFLDVNDAMLNATGYSKNEFLLLTFWDITPKKYDDLEVEQLKSLQKTGSFGPHEKEYICKDGTRYPIKFTGFLLTDVDGREVVCCLIENLGKQKEGEKTLKNLVFYDPLTGLPNRLLFSDRIQQAINHAQRSRGQGALLIFGVDRFKPVNDRYGYEVGDFLLQEVVARITEKVLHRNSDTFYRIGGDLFAILLPLISSIDGVEYVTESILYSLREAFEINGHKIKVSCSIGIAIFPDHGENEISITRVADAAMCQVKANGGDGYEIEK